LGCERGFLAPQIGPFSAESVMVNNISE
jgi:hypothetical protein